MFFNTLDLRMLKRYTEKIKKTTKKNYRPLKLFFQICLFFRKDDVRSKYLLFLQFPLKNTNADFEVILLNTAF